MEEVRMYMYMYYTLVKIHHLQTHLDNSQLRGGNKMRVGHYHHTHHHKHGIHMKGNYEAKLSFHLYMRICMHELIM